MENWIWISLYVVQTLVGAVFYRIYFNDVEESTEDCLLMSAIVIINCISLVFLIFYGIKYLFKQLIILIDFLAGVKNKTEEEWYINITKRKKKTTLS